MNAIDQYKSAKPGDFARKHIENTQRREQLQKQGAPLQGPNYPEQTQLTDDKYLLSLGGDEMGIDRFNKLLSNRAFSANNPAVQRMKARILGKGTKAPYGQPDPVGGNPMMSAIEQMINAKQQSNPFLVASVNQTNEDPGLGALQNKYMAEEMRDPQSLLPGDMPQQPQGRNHNRQAMQAAMDDGTLDMEFADPRMYDPKGL